MIVEQNELRMQPLEAPSKSTLAKATGIALLVALLLLFTAILPAEYGFDPQQGHETRACRAQGGA